jgi:hypothetical protein
MRLINDGKPLYLTSAPGKTFKLIENWEFEHDRYRGILFVPKGYKSDLASIPSWIFWWQWGKWNIAAIAHDYIYDHGYIWFKSELLMSSVAVKIPMSKAIADYLFLEICLALEINPIVAKLMFLAVYLFGRGNWEKC